MNMQIHHPFYLLHKLSFDMMIDVMANGKSEESNVSIHVCVAESGI